MQVYTVFEKRETLFGPTALLVILVAIILAFVILFPSEKALFSSGEKKQEQVEGQIGADAAKVNWLAIAYLRSQVRDGSATPEQYSQLVEALLDKGELNEAESVLNLYRQQDNADAEKILQHQLAIDIVRHRYLPENAPGYAEQQADILRKMNVLLEQDDVEPSLLSHYAELVLHMNQPELASEIYARLAEIQPEAQEQWLGKAAEWALAASKPALAAQYMGLLAEKTSPENRDAWLKQQIPLLEFSRQPEEALRVVTDLLSRHPANADLLQTGIRLALSSQQPELALEWNQKLLNLDPNNTDILVQQVQLALATQKVEYALTFNTQLLEDDPDNIELLKQQIQLTLAVQKLDEALLWNEKLIGLEPENLELLEQQVQLAIAYQKPEIASKWNQRLLEKQPNNADLIERQVQLAIAQEKRDEAVKWNKRLLALEPNNKMALSRQIDLVLADKNTALAAKYNARLLALDPNNSKVLERQMQFVLGSGQPKEALKYVRHWHTKEPNNLKIHKQLAQLEEWGGNPYEALKHWKVIQSRQPTIENAEQVQRLGEMLWQFDASARALTLISKKRKLSLKETEKLIQLYEKEGLPETAEKVLATYLKRHPERKVYVQLAELQKRSWQYRRALQTWQTVAQKYGRANDETLSRAEMHWRLREREKSFEIVKSFKGKLNPKEVYHSKLLAALGWNYKDSELAKIGYETLLASVKIKPTDIHGDKIYTTQERERLLALYVENKDVEKALAIAEKAWQDTQKDHYLTQMLYLAMDSKKDKFLQKVLSRLEEKVDSIRDQEIYWRAQAYLAERANDQAALDKAWQALLRISPNSPDIIAGLLWRMLDKNDVGKLRESLDKWQELAIDNSDLWLVYALAWQRLERHQKSLPWFERFIEKGTPDYSTLLSYAETLYSLGAADSAYRVRLFVFEQLRPYAEKFLQDKGKITDELQAYVNAIHHQGHPEQREFWVNLLQDLEKDRIPDEKREWIYEIAVAWFLASERHDYARLWLTRAHEERLKTRGWQRIVLALERKDKDELKQLLSEEGHMLQEDRVLALIEVDRRREALELAESGIVDGREPHFRDIARRLASVLRLEFPRYWGTEYTTASAQGFELDTLRLFGRYTFDNREMGLSLDVRQGNMRSDRFRLRGHRRELDLAATLHLGNSQHGGKITLGANQHDKDTVPYAKAEYHYPVTDNTQLRLKADLDAIPDETAVRHANGKKKRLELTLSHQRGSRHYGELSLYSQHYEDREGTKLVNSEGAVLELGWYGAMGTNEWRVGTQAALELNRDLAPRRDRDGYVVENQEPPPANAQHDETAVSLLVGGQIRRRLPREEYPQAGSLRYQASLWAGKTFPSGADTIQFNAGVGTRVLGNDELSLEVQHNQFGGINGKNDDQRISLQYRYHFD